jgi:hypothetical protein
MTISCYREIDLQNSLNLREIYLQIKNARPLRHNTILNPKRKRQSKIKNEENPGSCKRRVDEKNTQLGNRNSQLAAHPSQHSKPFSLKSVANILYHNFSN